MASRSDTRRVLQKSNSIPTRSDGVYPRVPPKPVALTIAGSDSGGCAGIQADLETFAAFGLHGLAAVTAVTAQNTRRVRSIHRVPAREIEAQLMAVFDDFSVDAVKIGMLGSRAAVETVAAALRRRRAVNVVIDPVLAASSGTALLPAAAMNSLRGELLPLAAVLTPNVPEAEALLARRICSVSEMAGAARDLLRFGARAVLLKGGHLPGAVVTDVLVEAGSAGARRFSRRRLPLAARGTGCTLAAAIAAGLALGLELNVAIARAERYLQACLRRAYRTGAGKKYALEHLAKGAIER
jgi:hydroxymethylpyrimidine/phosphomethylpyrimidine kinase